MADIKDIEVKTVQNWRLWLEKHHQQSDSIWLVSYKKHTDHYIPFGEIVDQALCFGWVDSAVRGVDKNRLKHLLSPRKQGSSWSKVNKDKVARLTADGLMHPAGLAKIEAAKADGCWTFLDDVEALVQPDDLKAAFARHPGSQDNWDGFPRSAKRAILEWIKTAKRPETRAKRIRDTAQKAAQNIRANNA